jgi:hypothetical protein
MRRPTQINNSSEDLNIWQAFTDLMSNAFLIMILFLLIGIFKSASDSKVKDQTIKDWRHILKIIKVMLWI